MRPGGPAPSHVDVWCVALDRAADAGCLSPSERERAARFHFDRDRDRFIAARSALRRILGVYLGLAPEDVAIGGREGEKPCVAGALRFNLSHSADTALIAVATGAEVGVDLEAKRPVPDLEALLALVCSDGEAARLLAMPSSSRDAAFLRCFTRKEALAKAWGLGLNAPLGRFEVSLANEATWHPLPGCPEARDQWALVNLELPGYEAAIAIEGPAPTIWLQEW